MRILYDSGEMLRVERCLQGEAVVSRGAVLLSLLIGVSELLRVRSEVGATEG